MLSNFEIDLLVVVFWHGVADGAPHSVVKTVKQIPSWRWVLKGRDSNTQLLYIIHFKTCMQVQFIHCSAYPHPPWYDHIVIVNKLCSSLALTFFQYTVASSVLILYYMYMYVNVHLRLVKKLHSIRLTKVLITHIKKVIQKQNLHVH